MITQETKLNIKGKTYTMENFAEKYSIATMDEALHIAQVLVKQGKASVVKNISEKEELISEALQRETLNSIVDAIDKEEEEHKVFKREQAKEDVDLINISLNFATSHEAFEAESWINDLGIEDTEISMKKGVVTVIVRGITPAEYGKISRKYQTEKAIKTTVDTASKAMQSTVGAVNFTATKVVAPVAKIAGEAGLNLGKGLVHTGVKVGAGLVNSGSKAIRDTKVALETDPEMLRAGRELREAKDAMLSFFKSKVNKSKSRSGISILD